MDAAGVRRNCRQVITTPRCGRYPQTFQHPPDRRDADPVAKTQQLALDPLVAPARVLPGHAPDQCGEPRVDRRAAAPGRGGPLRPKIRDRTRSGGNPPSWVPGLLGVLTGPRRWET